MPIVMVLPSFFFVPAYWAWLDVRTAALTLPNGADGTRYVPSEVISPRPLAVPSSGGNRVGVGLHDRGKGAR